MEIPKFELHVLHEGTEIGHESAFTSGRHVLVDTLSPWDSKIILSGLAEHGLTCKDIGHVVCTHGHVDHIGNLNMFADAPTRIIVGQSICTTNDRYHEHPFDEGIPYRIHDGLEVISTPGHTATDVSVVVRSVKDYGAVAIVGDLFEREEDIDDPSLWMDLGGSENPKLQRENRSRILRSVDYVVPGHGKMFKVTEAMRKELAGQLQESISSESLVERSQKENPLFHN